MTTLRQAHKKNYTCYGNELPQNNNLSLRGRGLMFYLLSLPDDWQVHLNHLIKVLKEGREVIMSTIKELKKYGFMHHHKLGFQAGWQYFVFEQPTSADKFKEFLRTIRVCQLLGKPNYSGNPILQSNNVYIQNTNSSTNTPKPPRRGPRSLLSQKRKQWALENEESYKAPGGYMAVREDGITIVSGNTEMSYAYNKREPFWASVGL